MGGLSGKSARHRDAESARRSCVALGEPGARVVIHAAAEIRTPEVCGVVAGESTHVDWWIL